MTIIIRIIEGWKFTRATTKRGNHSNRLGSSCHPVLWRREEGEQLLVWQIVRCAMACLTTAYKLWIHHHHHHHRVVGGQEHAQRTVSATTSVHSLALLPGPPVSDAVLAIIVERGLLGDSSSGSGLSFLLGPVPTNPQNRDTIIASSAGHGPWWGKGITPTNGGGKGGE